MCYSLCPLPRLSITDLAAAPGVTLWASSAFYESFLSYLCTLCSPSRPCSLLSPFRQLIPRLTPWALILLLTLPFSAVFALLHTQRQQIPFPVETSRQREEWESGCNVPAHRKPPFCGA